MSSLSPSLLVFGLLLCVAGGVLAARTARWMFSNLLRPFVRRLRPLARPLRRTLHKRTTESPAAAGAISSQRVAWFYDQSPRRSLRHCE